MIRNSLITRSSTLTALIVLLVGVLIPHPRNAHSASLAEIRVAFKLDPRLTGGVYLGERWVSPDTFTGYQVGTEFTVDVRAGGIDDQGGVVDINPEWIAADPDMATVSPVQGKQVTVTVRRAGMSRLTVASPEVSKELFVEATYIDTVIKVEISQTMPVEVEFIPYPPSPEPVLDASPGGARPVGVGPAAQGGDTIDIRIALDSFPDPVDIFFGVYAPVSLGSQEILLLRQDDTFQSMSAGLVPWRTNVSGPIDESLFGDIAVSDLPPGMYHLLLLVAPAAGSALQKAYLWQTAVGAGTAVTIETPLSGAQVVDPVESAGRGAGLLTVVLETRELASTQSFMDLTSDVTGSHIHMGAAGANGPVIVGFTGSAGLGIAAWAAPMGAVLTPQQLDALMNDELYFQAHTRQYPFGEIRGQILYPPGAPLL